MPNISQFANTATTAAQTLSNLILVTPQSNLGYQAQSIPNKDGTPSQLPPAILFNYEGEQSIGIESDITDHYVEDNTAIQDQIALRPETVTTHGFVGELNDVVPEPLAKLKEIRDKLLVLGAYTPQLTLTAAIAYNQALAAYQTAKNLLNSAVARWSSITNGNNQAQTQQQAYFQQFYGYWKSRTLFTVQTPWAVFDNMAIKSLRAIQTEDTRVITDFEVTFKKIRFASSVLETNNALIPANMQSRAAIAASREVDLGTTTPPLSPVTVRGGVTSILGGGIQ